VLEIAVLQILSVGCSKVRISFTSNREFDSAPPGRIWLSSRNGRLLVWPHRPSSLLILVYLAQKFLLKTAGWPHHDIGGPLLVCGPHVGLPVLPYFKGCLASSCK